MRRTHKKLPLLARVQFGKLGLAVFVLFIAWRILTPPSDKAAPISSPDGSKEARLKTIYYYDNQPSYKIYWRPAGEKSWMGLLYLPAATNAPADAAAEIEWNADSDRLDFLLNGTSIWHHAFGE